MNKVAAFALRRKNSILSMSEKMFCPPQPLRFWITPARAGKSECNSSSNDARWDHPRACGEKTLCAMMPRATGGSPPRVRGKVPGSASGHPAPRITPAYAGKSSCIVAFWGLHRDHPRVCGEKSDGGQASSYPLGSPPRVRGKVNIARFYITRHRITPAYAGKNP